MSCVGSSPLFSTSLVSSRKKAKEQRHSTGAQYSPSTRLCRLPHTKNPQPNHGNSTRNPTQRPAAAQSVSQYLTWASACCPSAPRPSVCGRVNTPHSIVQTCNCQQHIKRPHHTTHFRVGPNNLKFQLSSPHFQFPIPSFHSVNNTKAKASKPASQGGEPELGLKRTRSRKLGSQR